MYIFKINIFKKKIYIVRNPMIISKNDDYILQKNKPYIKIKVQVKK